MVESLQGAQTVEETTSRILSVSVNRGSISDSPDLTDKFQARDQALAALIERIAGGDQNALSALYDATNRLVYALALRILGDAAAAEEVLLFDVYVQAWQQASRYDSRRGQHPVAETGRHRTVALDAVSGELSRLSN